MGGRGTYAAGNNATYRYKTVDKIEGVKVLVGKDGLHDLPMESHSSKMYILLYPNGIFHCLRIYGDDHLVKLEIAYHRERNIDKHAKHVLHYHTYEYGPQFKDGMDRSGAMPMTKKLLAEYAKYLKGVKL